MIQEKTATVAPAVSGADYKKARQSGTFRQLLRRLARSTLRAADRPNQFNGVPHSLHLRESTRFQDIGDPGPLITNVFSRLKRIPGWLNVDDCGHFHLVLSYQSALGVKGDFLEIGSYHGRAAALMAGFLRSGERIVICDAFETETDDYYGNRPSPRDLVANIQGMNKELREDQIVIHGCLSSELRLDGKDKFRFVHLDGGHSAEQIYLDLALCGAHVVPHGVVVVDDYHSKQWPGVTEGTDRYLKENTSFEVLADLNRHGALGRKLYLVKGS